MANRMDKVRGRSVPGRGRRVLLLFVTAALSCLLQACAGSVATLASDCASGLIASGGNPAGCVAAAAGGALFDTITAQAQPSSPATRFARDVARRSITGLGDVSGAVRSVAAGRAVQAAMNLPPPASGSENVPSLLEE